MAGIVGEGEGSKVGFPAPGGGRAGAPGASVRGSWNEESGADVVEASFVGVSMVLMEAMVGEGVAMLPGADMGEGLFHDPDVGTGSNMEGCVLGRAFRIERGWDMMESLSASIYEQNDV